MEVGVASQTGRRPDNQDFAAAYRGTATERVTHGMVAMVADGVGGAKGGRVAAELACRSFVEAYYCQPATIGVATGAARAIDGFNAWLNGIAAASPELTGAATTFAALVLRGRRAHALHVGDSRVWHFRDGVLTRLTEDHVLPQPDLNHVLYRAVGIERTVRLDHRTQDLVVHDRFLITSDGVHGTLSARALGRLLGARGSAQADAAAIVDAALAGGSADNASAVVLDVVALPAPDHGGIAALAATLPVLPPPSVGESIDGFMLETTLAEGRYSRLFRATGPDGGRCVLKFPKPAILSESGARLAFTRELLIGARVHDPHVGEVIALPADRQTRLYVAMPFYEGETLEARLARGPLSLRSGLDVAAKLARGLASLHRLGIVHRDIKPDNVMLTVDGGARLIDLGVARLPNLEEFADTEIPGTPSYMAPELYEGERGDQASDQFALGATLYRLFTGALPYGEIEAFSRPRFDQPADPSRLRPDLPAWLAVALRRAVAVKPDERYGDVTELLLTLEGGTARAVPIPAYRPLIERNPVLFWQIVAVVLAAGLIASVIGR